MNRVAEALAESRDALPSAGPISDLVLEMISAPPTAASTSAGPSELATRFVDTVEDPLRDDDLQLGLYLCFELHYRAFAGVDPDWEWDPWLLAVRAVLEEAFFAALEDEVGVVEGIDPERVGELLFRIESEDEGVSLSRHLEVKAGIEEFREFVVHRSFYQLKESDPHSWAIPRLDGPAKTALWRSRRTSTAAAGRSGCTRGCSRRRCGRWVWTIARTPTSSTLPGETLATVNLMSASGLRRRRRGVIVGHLAMFEMTSSMPNRRYGNALRRLGYDEEATDFYDEHVEADAVHENIAAYDLAGGLARQEPELAADIIFGARALLLLEDRLGEAPAAGVGGGPNFLALAARRDRGLTAQEG